MVARLVRAPDMRDISELFGAARNLLLIEPVLLKKRFHPRDESLNIQNLRRKSASRTDSSGGEIDNHQLPIGLQLLGKALDEARIFQIAHAYEQSTDWHKARPKLELLST